MSKRVLVTGGAGFIGSHIVEYHLNKGDTVYAIDNFSSGSEKNITPYITNPKFRFKLEDILTWKDIDKIVPWADLIYHMAAIVGMFRVLKEPEKVLAVNIAGSERLLRAINAADWKARLLIASSSEVYGSSPKSSLSEDDNLIVESNARNRWHYAVSKLTDESFGLAYTAKHSLPITVLRFFNTIGPRQGGEYGMVVPRFIQQALNNEPITIFGTGEQTRSFCDVRDTVKMLDLVAENDKTIGEILNMGNDQEVSINQLAKMIKTYASSNSELIHVPYDQAYGEEFVDILRRRPDLTKLKSFINFQCDWTLEKTLRDIISDMAQKPQEM